MQVEEPAQLRLQSLPYSQFRIFLPYGNDFNINSVNFSAGARHKMPIHRSNQALSVTAGKGIIATETAEKVLTTGGLP
jgi:hypothetical protein